MKKQQVCKIETTIYLLKTSMMLQYSAVQKSSLCKDLLILYINHLFKDIREKEILVQAVVVIHPTFPKKITNLQSQKMIHL